MDFWKYSLQNLQIERNLQILIRDDDKTRKDEREKNVRCVWKTLSTYTHLAQMNWSYNSVYF